MYKILFYTMMFFATSLMANNLKWAENYDAGIQRATKEKKPVLFIFSRHTCKYCVILEKTTLSDKEVVEKLNKNFVSIIAYSDDNDAMPRELWRPGTPSIWFLQSDGAPMFQPLMGAVDKENFLKALTIVESEFKKTQKRVK